MKTHISSQTKVRTAYTHIQACWVDPFTDVKQQEDLTSEGLHTFRTLPKSTHFWSTNTPHYCQTKQNTRGRYSIWRLRERNQRSQNIKHSPLRLRTHNSSHSKGRTALTPLLQWGRGPLQHRKNDTVRSKDNTLWILEECEIFTQI